MNNFTLRTYRYERSKRNRWVSRFFTLAAAVIVLFIHAAWFYVAAVLQPDHAPDRPEKVHVFSYMNEGDTSDVSDVRLIRSPVLLSLPTRVGFSGPLLGNASLEQSPSFREQPAEFLGDLEEPFEVEPYGKSQRALKELAQKPRPDKTPGYVRDDEGAQTLNTMTHEGLVAYWMDQPTLVSEEIVVAPDTASWGTDPWAAVLYVCVNANAQASQALLETPAPEKLINTELIRAVRGTVFTTRPQGGCGRLMIRYNPVSPAEKGI